MVSTVLPVYLVLHLGLTPFHFGVVDGLYHGVTALVRLLGGYLADRLYRYKEVAAVGYALSAVCKLGLLAAGGAWPLIASVVAIDRAGKGIRTAPRDALISLSTTPSDLATGFGVHRALDSAGAMLGPLVALGLLLALPSSFDVLFVASFSIAAIGLGVLLLFAENLHPGSHTSARPRLAAVLRGLVRPRGFRRLMLAALVLSFATVSDGFIYLALQREIGFDAGLFPLLYVGTAASYLLLAVPAGRLADRFGRRATFLTGYALLAVVYVVALNPGSGGLGVGACLALLGAYYAMTDGVLMALASAILPTEQRASGLALLGTVVSVARLMPALVFGAIWTRFELDSSLILFLGALGVAMAVAGAALRPVGRSSDDSALAAS
jgi:predicted MFS family arabinose efflux permease